jgi:hypothetical protein
VLERRFAAIGARVKVAGPAVGGPRIDIRSDRRGEFFDISFAGSGDDAGVEVVDIAPRSLIVPGSDRLNGRTPRSGGLRGREGRIRVLVPDSQLGRVAQQARALVFTNKRPLVRFQPRPSLATAGNSDGRAPP